MSGLSSLHINTEPTWRGGEQQTLYLVAGLITRGHPATLVAQRGGPLARRAREAGVPTVEVPMRGEADLGAVLGLASLLRRVRPRVVHFHTSHAHTLGAMAAALLGGRRPRTVLTRRVDFSIFRHSFLGLNRWKYRSVDRIVAISEAIRDVLLADGIDPRRIDLVPSGVDPARFDGVRPVDLRHELGLPPATRLVANVAHLADHKGQVYLVDAAPRILSACPDAAIIIIGEGELRDPLMARARDLGVAGRVLFPGFRTDVPGILRGIDIYVMPSHMEGLGTAVLDALCCALPVVAARAGGIPEIVRDRENGLLVPPRDPEALAAAVIGLLRDPALARALAARGPATVRDRFGVDRMVDGNVAVYRRLVAGRPISRRASALR